MTIKVPTYDANGADLLRAADVTSNIEERFLASSEFGSGAQLAADKPLAQVVQPFAHELGQVYDLAQATIDARRRVSAEGVQLDNLGEAIGVPRQPATYSTVTLTLGGAPSTVIAAGKRGRIPGTDIYWALVDEVTIPGGGSIDGAAQCTVIGSYEASATSITEIADLVTGWDTVTNAAAATTGDEIETDSTYRRRQKESLSAGGTARPAAIRAALEKLDFVTAAAVIENLKLVTDARGIEGKSYMPIVTPSGLSTEQEELIILAIWLVTPAGIGPIAGTQQYVVTDDQGYEQPIAFQYGTDTEIYITLRLWTTDAYPSDGDTQLVAALKVFDDDYSLGSTVVPDDIRDYLRDPTTGVPGIQHMEVWIKVGSTPISTDTFPITMPVDETPYFDSQITIDHPA